MVLPGNLRRNPVTVPTSATGQSNRSTVSGSVTNTGVAAATNQWLDYVYLSSDMIGEKSEPCVHQTNQTSLASVRVTPNTIILLPNIPGTAGSSLRAGRRQRRQPNEQAETTSCSKLSSTRTPLSAVLTNATPETDAVRTPLRVEGYVYNPKANSRGGRRLRPSAC